MRARLWDARAALAAGVMALLAVELSLPGGSGISMPPPGLPGTAPQTAGDGRADQWSAAILARPLFTPSRRPAAPPDTVESKVMPQLSAIIITGNHRSAIFVADGQKPQVVDIGGSVNGYLVNAISAGEVNLTGQEGRVTLRPKFTASPPGVQTSQSAPSGHGSS
jgi:hypothetical protein